jgi:Icc-related predicted phosphoesterase
MMSAHVRRALAIGSIHGAIAPLDELLGRVGELQVEVIVVVGDFRLGWTDAAAYRAIFTALGKAGLPTFWVPGPMDAPIRHYLREAANMELVYPNLHGVHGTAALGPQQWLFAGVGGEIADDPETIRDEEALLKYPGWEAEYRLKIAREFDEHERVLLFSTPPSHKGLDEPGSDVVAELIKTYDPRFAVVAGDEPSERRVGPTLVACPGSLERGDYVVVDLAHGGSVETGRVAEATERAPI